MIDKISIKLPSEILDNILVYLSLEQAMHISYYASYKIIKNDIELSKKLQKYRGTQKKNNKQLAKSLSVKFIRKIFKADHAELLNYLTQKNIKIANSHWKWAFLYKSTKCIKHYVSKISQYIEKIKKTQKKEIQFLYNYAVRYFNLDALQILHNSNITPLYHYKNINNKIYLIDDIYNPIIDDKDIYDMYKTLSREYLLEIAQYITENELGNYSEKTIQALIMANDSNALEYLYNYSMAKAGKTNDAQNMTKWKCSLEFAAENGNLEIVKLLSHKQLANNYTCKLLDDILEFNYFRYLNFYTAGDGKYEKIMEIIKYLYLNKVGFYSNKVILACVSAGDLDSLKFFYDSSGGKSGYKNNIGSWNSTLTLILRSYPNNSAIYEKFVDFFIEKKLVSFKTVNNDLNLYTSDQIMHDIFKKLHNAGLHNEIGNCTYNIDYLVTDYNKNTHRYSSKNKQDNLSEDYIKKNLDFAVYLLHNNLARFSHWTISYFVVMNDCKMLKFLWNKKPNFITKKELEIDFKYFAEAAELGYYDVVEFLKSQCLFTFYCPSDFKYLDKIIDYDLIMYLVNNRYIPDDKEDELINYIENLYKQGKAVNRYSYY